MRCALLLVLAYAAAPFVFLLGLLALAPSLRDPDTTRRNAESIAVLLRAVGEMFRRMRAK